MRRTSGFTLIEVLIALAIVSVALAAVMRAVAVATDDQGRLRDRRLALVCAQNQWEKLRLLGARPQEARLPCLQGRSEFIVQQALSTGEDGQASVQLLVVARDAPRQRLVLLQLPWAPLP